MNPNYFGISILEFNSKDNFKVIHKECIDISELQKKSKNKVHFELYEINHHILKLCKTWKVSNREIATANACLKRAAEAKADMEAIHPDEVDLVSRLKVDIVGV